MIFNIVWNKMNLVLATKNAFDGSVSENLPKILYKINNIINPDLFSILGDDIKNFCSSKLHNTQEKIKLNQAHQYHKITILSE